MDLSYWNRDNIINNEKTFVHDIINNNLIQKIPLLNYMELDELRDNQLVRFRGMIQDMSDPEFYMERYEVATDNGTRIQEGKYRDLVEIKENETVNIDSTINVTGEREALFVVNVPGINQWVIDFEKNIFKHKTSESVNQTLNDKTDEFEEITLHNNSRKCMVKIYNNFNSNKLNEIIDAIGFLSIYPILDDHNDNVGECINKQESMLKTSPISIPHLHCIYYKHLNTINPLLDDTIFLNNNYDNDNHSILKNIKLILTQLLFDDEIAANYLLCHLISKVYIRNDYNTLGQFTLNIYNIPSNISSEYILLFNEIIKLLIPTTIEYNMTIDNLNSKPLIPVKDYDLNRLNASVLQLTNNTEIIINETVLTEGKLNAIGINNINYINNIIDQQKLTCDFQYYKIDYNVNYNLLILSDNKTLLSSNVVHIPLKYKENTINLIQETINAIKYFLTNIPVVSSIRRYMTTVKNEIFTIKDEDQEIIQNDFHMLLKNNNKQIKSDDLHNLLIILRLLCLSNGKNKFDLSLWNTVKTMEIERKSRISNYKFK